MECCSHSLWPRFGRWSQRVGLSSSVCIPSWGLLVLRRLKTRVKARGFSCVCVVFDLERVSTQTTATTKNITQQYIRLESHGNLMARESYRPRHNRDTGPSVHGNLMITGVL